MTTLERRIEVLESKVIAGLCRACSLSKLFGDNSIGEACPHPQRRTHEEVLREFLAEQDTRAADA